MARDAQLAALGGRGAALLRGQHATERAVAGVQALKAEITGTRRDSRQAAVVPLRRRRRRREFNRKILRG